MQFIFDNIVALLVSITLLFILLVISQRNSEAAVDETGFSALRNQQMTFVQTVQRDMAGIYRVETVHEQPDSTFSFWTRLGNSPDTTRVIYKRTRVGQRGDVDLFQILRYESATGNFSPGSPSGGSPPTVADWKIVGLNRAGNPPQSPADIRQIHVRFEALLPFETGNSLVRHPWEGTFFPVLLESQIL